MPVPATSPEPDAPTGEAADVTSAREVMLGSKHDLNLTGNGPNRPNDFGHRPYAQSILTVPGEQT
jgi:hypothetical protein